MGPPPGAQPFPGGPPPAGRPAPAGNGQPPAPVGNGQPPSIGRDEPPTAPRGNSVQGGPVPGRSAGDGAPPPPPAAEVPSEVPGRHRRLAGAPGPSDERGDTGRKRPAFWKELPLLVVVALVLTFLIQTFLAKVYVIPSGSMETTLHGCTGCNNDRVLVDKVTYRFTDPAPGDVVVFRGPDSWSSEVVVQPPNSALLRGLQQLGSLVGLAPPDEKDFVKRVIAVGGQTVQCCDSTNHVLVDGEPLSEPYIYYLPEAGAAAQSSFDPVVVPQGELWMMGDSRNNSADSRVGGHGPIPVQNVIGKARLIVLPLPRFGPIDAIDPHAVGLGAPGTDLPAPLALGLLAALPLAARQRRSLLGGADPGRFLPTTKAARRTGPRRR